MKQNEIRITEEFMFSSIHLVRGQKVILDKDLATLYGVETKRLKEAVKRNIERFPEDFMFQLSLEEFENLRSQIATSSWGGTRYMPYAFTEQGVAMLSSVLTSKRAIEVNISIMRLFVKMRSMINQYSELVEKLYDLENKILENEGHIAGIYKIITELLEPTLTDRPKIGFKRKVH